MPDQKNKIACKKCSTLGGLISSTDHLQRWFPKYHLLNWVGLFPPIPPIDKTMQHFITRKHEKNVNVFGSNFTPFPNLLATRK
jgi:hypothetical protein